STASRWSASPPDATSRRRAGAPTRRSFSITSSSRRSSVDAWPSRPTTSFSGRASPARPSASSCSSRAAAGSSPSREAAPRLLGTRPDHGEPALLQLQERLLQPSVRRRRHRHGQQEAERGVPEPLRGRVVEAGKDAVGDEEPDLVKHVEPERDPSEVDERLALEREVERAVAAER